MVVIASVFIAYTFAGPLMPEVIQHKGASITTLRKKSCPRVTSTVIASRGIASQRVGSTSAQRRP